MIHLSGARDERLVADNYQREKIPAYVAAFHHRDGGSLQRGGFRDRALRRGQPGGARRLFACRQS